MKKIKANVRIFEKEICHQRRIAPGDMISYPFLEAATLSAQTVTAKIRRTIRELKICMFCVGARTITDLQRVELIRDAGVAA